MNEEYLKNGQRKKMKNYFLKSIKLINSNIIFVFLLSLCGVFYQSFLSFLFIVLGLIILPGIYGYFTEIVKFGKNETPFFQNVREHFFNYLLVSIIISIPIFLFIFFGGGLEWKIKTIIEITLLSTVSAIAIYIFPMVFIKKINTGAIPLGLKFLAKNFKYSLPIFILALFPKIIEKLSIILLLHVSKSVVHLIISVYILKLITTYITLLIFVTASIILVEKSSLKIDN